MKMQYHHSGRQFFFISLTMEERTNVLSQLEDEQARPRLTVKGETVKSALLALHTLFPCATVSDFVIMPDHIHFLLIVNYGVDPVFNPLWVTHRLMDAVETVWNGRGSLPEPLAPADMAAVIRQADTLAREKLGKLSVAGSGGAAPSIPSAGTAIATSCFPSTPDSSKPFGVISVSTPPEPFGKRQNPLYLTGSRQHCSR